MDIDKLSRLLTSAGFLLAVGLVGSAVYAAEKARRRLDPTDPNNLFYDGVNSVGSSVTGNDDFSLGSWLYDVIHGDDYDPNDP
jgi:hypothetical protein